MAPDRESALADRRGRGSNCHGQVRPGPRPRRATRGEVVNADAMQFYRGMDIGTAKLPPGERRGVRHHQLDVLDVTEEASVAGYQVAARADIAAVRDRGHRPLLVGGSGLYVRAALDRLEIPPTDAAVRTRLEASPKSSAATPCTHGCVVWTRGLPPRSCPPTSVVSSGHGGHRADGQPFSATMPKREFVSPAVVLGLRLDRDVLVDRIDRRVERMWENGLRTETEALLEVGLRHGVTASGPSATARPTPSSTVTSTRPRRGATPLRRRAATPGDRSRCSGPIRASSGSTRHSPDLLDRALTAFASGAASATRHGGECLT